MSSSRQWAADVYNTPIISGYRGRRFSELTLAARTLVWSALSARGVYQRLGPWTHCFPAAARRRPWQPKVYICVRPHDYWPTVLRLLIACEGKRWKFYSASRGYHRPDKIVVYPEDERDLRSVVLLVRRELQNCRFHSLSHAAATWELGLESRSESGLYVGADLTFAGVSWRLYRAVCVGWLQKNAPFVRMKPGGIEAWAAALNLSASHRGPASLSPEQSASRAVLRTWQRMTRAVDTPTAASRPRARKG